nr:hypothetical protein Q903MT_gene1926 [Picea sitchensis]
MTVPLRHYLHERCRITLQLLSLLAAYLLTSPFHRLLLTDIHSIIPVFTASSLSIRPATLY